MTAEIAVLTVAASLGLPGLPGFSMAALRCPLALLLVYMSSDLCRIGYPWSLYCAFLVGTKLRSSGVVYRYHHSCACTGLVLRVCFQKKSPYILFCSYFRTKLNHVVQMLIWRS